MSDAKIPYSKYIEKNGFVFISGHIPLKNGKLLNGTIEENTQQVMENLKSVLDEASITFKDVVKTTIYLTDIANYTKINEIYASYISEPYPARETISVKELPLGADIEISMIAVKS